MKQDRLVPGKPSKYYKQVSLTTQHSDTSVLMWHPLSPSSQDPGKPWISTRPGDSSLPAVIAFCLDPFLNLNLKCLLLNPPYSMQNVVLRQYHKNIYEIHWRHLFPWPWLDLFELLAHQCHSSYPSSSLSWTELWVGPIIIILWYYWFTITLAIASPRKHHAASFDREHRRVWGKLKQHALSLLSQIAAVLDSGMHPGWVGSLSPCF